MKILIVDDVEVTRLSLAGILGQDGAQVIQAGDGEEAWAMLEAGLRPDVCCSDVSMPRLDGLGLLARVRAHLALEDLPFVLISGAADRETVEAAASQGVAGYVLKPFLVQQTRSTLDRVVREHRAARAEHFLVTCRRLGVTLDDLQRSLAALESDIRALADGLAAGGLLADPEPLDLLLGRSRGLGLWRGAALVQSALPRGVALAPRLLALREAARLVADQSGEIAALTSGA